MWRSLSRTAEDHTLKCNNKSMLQRVRGFTSTFITNSGARAAFRAAEMMKLPAISMNSRINAAFGAADSMKRAVTLGNPQRAKFRRFTSTSGTDSKIKAARRVVDLMERSVTLNDLSNPEDIPGPLYDKLMQYKKLISSMDHLEQLLSVAIAENDTELRTEVQAEISVIEKDIYDIWLKVTCEYPDVPGSYVDITCGAGGQESCDWVANMRNMYVCWSEIMKYDIEIKEEEIEGQGYKYCLLQIMGKYAYDFLKNESGIHRFTRISPYGGGTKLHTSFTSVRVMPVIISEHNAINSIEDIKIEQKDIKIETMKASGPGGQHVNKTESAVRIVHLPTNIIVTCRQERNQHSNKETAFNILRSKLYAIELEKKRQLKAKLRSEEVCATWGSKIRNYTLQHNIVKDYKTGIEIRDCRKVFSGEGLHVLMEETLALECKQKLEDEKAL